jgi:hypothetical protein
VATGAGGALWRSRKQQVCGRRAIHLGTSVRSIAQRGLRQRAANARAVWMRGCCLRRRSILCEWTPTSHQGRFMRVHCFQDPSRPPFSNTPTLRLPVPGKVSS